MGNHSSKNYKIKLCCDKENEFERMPLQDQVHSTNNDVQEETSEDSKEKTKDTNDSSLINDMKKNKWRSWTFREHNNLRRTYEYNNLVNHITSLSHRDPCRDNTIRDLTTSFNQKNESKNTSFIKNTTMEQQNDSKHNLNLSDIQNEINLSTLQNIPNDLIFEELTREQSTSASNQHQSISNNPSTHGKPNVPRLPLQELSDYQLNAHENNYIEQLLKDQDNLKQSSVRLDFTNVNLVSDHRGSNSDSNSNIGSITSDRIESYRRAISARGERIESVVFKCENNNCNKYNRCQKCIDQKLFIISKNAKINTNKTQMNQNKNNKDSERSQ